MTPWIDAIALWMADFYLAATMLLIIACAALNLVKQPVRRMAVAWGTLISLLVAALLCQSASRPRIDPRRILTGPVRPAVQFETTAAASGRAAGLGDFVLTSTNGSPATSRSGASDWTCCRASN